MDRTIVPTEGAKLRLVTAAEELIAARGFEAVSVRDITKQANMNIASVNYHFGSRDGLVAAVMNRHLTPVYDERIERLERTERSGGPGKVLLEGLLESWVRPVVAQARRATLSEGHAFKLLGRMLGEHAQAMPEGVVARGKQAFSLAMRILAKAQPAGAADELAWRLHFLTGALVHALTGQEVLYRDAEGVSGKPDFDEVLARLTRFCLAGMREGESGEPVVEDPGAQVMFNF